MKLTKREIELNNAREQGQRDYEDHCANDDSYLGSDTGLKAAYQMGWRQAKADYYAFYG